MEFVQVTQLPNGCQYVTNRTEIYVFEQLKYDA